MKRLLGLAIVAIVGMSASWASAQPLVDVNWVKANAGKPGVVMLDVTGQLTDYMRGHVPGAVFTDYAKDGWRVKDKNGTPGMLPEPAQIEKLVGGLGIDNSTHVVILPAGANATEMGTATRIYWTFKVMGHDKVSILDGGLAAYTADKKNPNPLEAGRVAPQARMFKAKLRPEYLATKEEVQKAMAKGTPLVDNRPADYYIGVTRSPVTKTAGTIPGAKSLPQNWITENDGGKFRSAAELQKLYAAAGVATSGEQINFCNTGHWASVGWFASSELLGNKNAKMYDGSMAEWTADPKAPIEQKIKPN